MNDWQREIYGQVDSFVSGPSPALGGEEAAIKFTRTQAYLIKTTIDDLMARASVLQEKLRMAQESILALKDRHDR